MGEVGGVERKPLLVVGNFVRAGGNKQAARHGLARNRETTIVGRLVAADFFLEQ